MEEKGRIRTEDGQHGLGGQGQIGLAGQTSGEEVKAED